MNKEDVIRFFDEKAVVWDDMDETEPDIINAIFDNAKIQKGVSVLDVACGTGVLIPFYRERGVSEIVGIDISSEMIKRATEKYADEHTVFFCGDIEDYPINKKFDRVVLYNAFPHFPDPSGLVKTLYSFLNEAGILTIAHGKSREVIDAHHKGSAAAVSNGLMSIEDMKQLCLEAVEKAAVIKMVSDDRMYQIVLQEI